MMNGDGNLLAIRKAFERLEQMQAASRIVVLSFENLAHVSSVYANHPPSQIQTSLTLRVERQHLTGPPRVLLKLGMSGNFCQFSDLSLSD